MEARLKEETRKWLERAQEKRKEVSVNKDVPKEESSYVIDNIDSYIEDCEHFLESDQLVEAFEASVWSWAFLEIGLNLGVLRVE